MSSLHELLEPIGRSGVGPLTRIIHEADTVRHNINGGQYFRQVYAAVLENWLGLNRKTSLKGSFASLPMFRGR